MSHRFKARAALAAAAVTSGVVALGMSPGAPGSTAGQGPEAQALGKLLLARPGASSREWRFVADIAAFAAAHPQDPATMGGLPGQEIAYDSNPYDIVPFRGGYAIADAAANDVLW